MAEESFQEKTEQATPKRKEEAREKGQVARSTELSSVAILATGLLALWGLGGFMRGRLEGVMFHSFVGIFDVELDALSIQSHLQRWMLDFAGVLWPLILFLLISAITVIERCLCIIFSSIHEAPFSCNIARLNLRKN